MAYINAVRDKYCKGCSSSPLGSVNDCASFSFPQQWSLNTLNWSYPVRWALTTGTGDPLCYSKPAATRLDVQLGRFRLTTTLTTIQNPLFQVVNSARTLKLNDFVTQSIINKHPWNSHRTFTSHPQEGTFTSTPSYPLQSSCC